MKKTMVVFFFVCVGILTLSTLLIQPVNAQAELFNWSSFDSGGSTAYGVYEHGYVTILSTGDLVQLIWTGPDDQIDPPNPDGTTTDDDEILATAAIQNDAPLPPPLQNKGYIPVQDYTFFPGDPQEGGIVYIRAWNADTAGGATAYGNSTTATLSSGGSFNAPRWEMTHTPTAVVLSSFNSSVQPIHWLVWAAFVVVAAAIMGILLVFRTQTTSR